MSMPDFKSFTFKDWLYFGGVVCALAGAWATMNWRLERMEVDAKASTIRQEVIDHKQDATMKELSVDLKNEIRAQTAEIKEELRDLRKDFYSSQKGK
jgi:hypothetical protein